MANGWHFRVTSANGSPIVQRAGREADSGGGVAGGLVAGAIIGSAAARPYDHGGHAYYGPVCHQRRERYRDGWAWNVRRVRVCR